MRGRLAGIEPAREGAPEYGLLDAGDGRRLERFGRFIIDRPAPGAGEPRRSPARWGKADLRYDAATGWSGGSGVPAPWSIVIDGLTMELRPTSAGGLGLFPEHAANLPWLEAAIRTRGHRGSPPSILNLFAHTGLATLAAARAGAAVVHVDAARSSVTWARRNALLSGLADRPVRWLVDDATAFSEREARRGNRYDGIVIDPPSAGHARGHGRGARWAIHDDLPRLLEACARISTDEAFVLLTAHTTGLSGEALAQPFGAAFASAAAGIHVSDLALTAESGARLRLGCSVRLEPLPDVGDGAAPARNAAP